MIHSFHEILFYQGISGMLIPLQLLTWSPGQWLVSKILMYGGHGVSSLSMIPLFFSLFNISPPFSIQGAQDMDFQVSYVSAKTRWKD